MSYGWSTPLSLRKQRGFTKPQSHGQPSPVWLSSLRAELIPNAAFISQPEKAESTPAPCQGHPQLWHLHNLGLPRRIHSFPQTPKFNGRCITVPSLICTVKAVINLLESELPPPTWAIFQPFSGIIIRDRDVNISSPKPRKRGRGSNLGEFPAGSCAVSNSVELGLSGDRFGEVETVSCLSLLLPCYINRT